MSTMLWLLKNTMASSKAHQNKKKKMKERSKKSQESKPSPKKKHLLLDSPFASNGAGPSSGQMGDRSRTIQHTPATGNSLGIMDRQHVLTTKASEKEESAQAGPPAWGTPIPAYQHVNEGQSHSFRASRQSRHASKQKTACAQPVYITRLPSSCAKTTTAEKLAWVAEQAALSAVAAKVYTIPGHNGLQQHQILTYGPGIPTQDLSAFSRTHREDGFPVHGRGGPHGPGAGRVPDSRHGVPQYLPTFFTPIQTNSFPAHRCERSVVVAPFKFGITIETILVDRSSNAHLQMWEVTPSGTWNTVRPHARAVEVARHFRHTSKASKKNISSSRMLVQGQDNRIPLDDPRRFCAWELNYESSISLEGYRAHVGRLGEFGVSFVSPVVDIDARGTWVRDIDNFFDVVKGWCDFEPNRTCGTHFSVLPFGGWTLTMLKSLARAVVYFEEVIVPLDPVPGSVDKVLC